MFIHTTVIRKFRRIETVTSPALMNITPDYDSTAAEDTPKQPPGVSGTERPLTLTELRMNRYKKVHRNPSALSSINKTLSEVLQPSTFQILAKEASALKQIFCVRHDASQDSKNVTKGCGQNRLLAASPEAFEKVDIPLLTEWTSFKKSYVTSLHPCTVTRYCHNRGNDFSYSFDTLFNWWP
jgi:hypothetical protein